MNTKVVCVAVVVLVGICSVNTLSQVSDVITRADGNHTIFYDAKWKVLQSSEGAAYYRKITYKNGKPIGVTRDYYISGKPQWVGRITVEHEDDAENQYEGTVTYYYESGVTSETTSYKNGMRNGASTSYYENGKIKTVSNYHDGREQGQSTYYREDGRKYGEYEYRSGALKKMKLYWDDNKGYSIVYDPKWNEAAGTHDGEYHRYSANGDKKDVVVVRRGKIEGTIWKAPSMYAKTKEWQSAKKMGIKYFVGTWYGTEPALNPYQTPTTYRIDIVKSRSGEYYLWKIEYNMLSTTQKMCSRGYLEEVGYNRSIRTYPDVTEARFDEGEDQGTVELCGSLYGSRDCRVLFVYSEDRGWFTTTGAQYVNLKKK